VAWYEQINEIAGLYFMRLTAFCSFWMGEISVFSKLHHAACICVLSARLASDMNEKIPLPLLAIYEDFDI
jgi:hypothetical protein